MDCSDNLASHAALGGRRRAALDRVSPQVRPAADNQDPDFDQFKFAVPVLSGGDGSAPGFTRQTLTATESAVA